MKTPTQLIKKKKKQVLKRILPYLKLWLPVFTILVNRGH